MARERMVTRTIETTVCEYIALDIISKETVQDYVEITGITDEKKTLDLVKKEIETDTFKVVAILNTSKHERLFGMKEQEFFNMAVELDPETRKPIDA